MPRYKPVHPGLKRFPVDFDKQIQPGSCEYVFRYHVGYPLKSTVSSR